MQKITISNSQLFPPKPANFLAATFLRAMIQKAVTEQDVFVPDWSLNIRHSRSRRIQEEKGIRREKKKKIDTMKITLLNAASYSSIAVTRPKAPKTVDKLNATLPAPPFLVVVLLAAEPVAVLVVDPVPVLASSVYPQRPLPFICVTSKKA